MKYRTVCDCGLKIAPETKYLHRPNCGLNTYPLTDLIAQSIGDPGSVLLPRGAVGQGSDAVPETVTRWGARAVVETLTAHGRGGLTIGTGLGFLYLDDGEMTTLSSGSFRCQSRSVDPDGVVRRCGEVAWHPDRTCRWLAEVVDDAD